MNLYFPGAPIHELLLTIVVAIVLGACGSDGSLDEPGTPHDEAFDAGSTDDADVSVEEMGPDVVGPFETFALTGKQPSLYSAVTGGFVTFAQGATEGEIIVFQDREVHRFPHRTGLGKVAWANPNSKAFAVLADTDTTARETVDVLIWDPEAKSLELFTREFEPLFGGQMRTTATVRSRVGVIYLRSSIDNSIAELDLKNQEISIIELESTGFQSDPATGRAVIQTVDPDGAWRAWAYEPATGELTDLGNVPSGSGRIVNDGQQVLFRSFDPGGLQLWSFETGETTVVDSNVSWQPAFLDEDRYVVVFGTPTTASTESSLKIHDLESGEVVIDEPFTDRDSFVVSADATRVAFLSGDTVVTRSLVDGSRAELGFGFTDFVVTRSSVGFRTVDRGYVVWHEVAGIRQFEAIQNGYSKEPGDIWLIEHETLDRGILYHAPSDTTERVNDLLNYLPCQWSVSPDGTRILFTTFRDPDERLYLWSTTGGLRVVAFEGMANDLESGQGCYPIDSISDNLSRGVVSWRSQTSWTATAWEGDETFQLESTSVSSEIFDDELNHFLYTPLGDASGSVLKMLDFESREKTVLDEDFATDVVAFEDDYLWVGRGAYGAGGFVNHARIYPKDGSSEPVDLFDRVNRLFVLFDEFLLYEKYGGELGVALPRDED